MTQIASHSLLIKNTSPDSKSWSDFLPPQNFPTSLLFFLSILLSLSILSDDTNLPNNQVNWLPVFLEVEDSSCISQALEVILGGFATFCLERRNRK
jgi:hypothetical protein